MSATIEKEQTLSSSTWIDICKESDLVDNSGICAVYSPNVNSEGQSRQPAQQVALFYLPRLGRVFVLSNWDPIGKANVMYRGIVGSIGDEPMITSPLYKQHYSLISGQCFEQEDMSLTTYQCRIVEGKVQITNDIQTGVK